MVIFWVSNLGSLVCNGSTPISLLGSSLFINGWSDLCAHGTVHFGDLCAFVAYTQHQANILTSERNEMGHLRMSLIAGVCVSVSHCCHDVVYQPTNHKISAAGSNKHAFPAHVPVETVAISSLLCQLQVFPTFSHLEADFSAQRMRFKLWGPPAGGVRFCKIFTRPFDCGCWRPRPLSVLLLPSKFSCQWGGMRRATGGYLPKGKGSWDTHFI